MHSTIVQRLVPALLLAEAVVIAACGATQGGADGSSVRARVEQPTVARMHGQVAESPQSSGTAEASHANLTPHEADTANAASADPAFTQGPFTGAAACAMCHDGIVDAEGRPASIVQAWSSTMMANAARDPFWKAKLESEQLRNPEHSGIVNDTCTRCHAPMAHVLSKNDGAALTLSHGGIDPSSPYYSAAQDGVSCTLCHQIQDRDLGTNRGFDGKFVIGADRAIFGPYQDVFTMPMQHMVDYTPQYGAHVLRSEFCATCHDVETPIIDHTGQLTTGAQGFPEQTPYTEWKNSAFALTTTCADCHMGRTDGVILSTRPPWLNTARNGFALHGFAGANKLMLSVLDRERTQLGVTANDFSAILARTDVMLGAAAKLELESSHFTESGLELAIRVLNTTGHKLPTSFPSRRVVLHLQVLDARNQVVFESGRVDADGNISGSDATQDLSRVEPHHDWIDDPQQAQVYESVMQDTAGSVTFTLLRAASYRKDNRLLPRGADKTTLPAEVAVRGEALTDADFQGGADVVHYRVKELPTGPYRVVAALLYQTIGARFARELFLTQGAAVTWFEQVFRAAPFKTVELARLETTLP
jgi:hypothetical protein